MVLGAAQGSPAAGSGDRSSPYSRRKLHPLHKQQHHHWFTVAGCFPHGSGFPRRWSPIRNILALHPTRTARKVAAGRVTCSPARRGERCGSIRSQRRLVSICRAWLRGEPRSIVGFLHGCDLSVHGDVGLPAASKFRSCTLSGCLHGCDISVHDDVGLPEASEFRSCALSD
jgi:hypothetical protein